MPPPISTWLEELGDGPVAIVGYCMGGRVGWHIATAFPDRVAALGAFHTGGLVTDGDDSPHLAAGSITAEVYLGHADNDGSMTPEHVATIERALEDAGVRYRSELYEGAAHGYTMADTPMYGETADARHFAELFALLDRTIGAPGRRPVANALRSTEAERPGAGSGSGAPEPPGGSPRARSGGEGPPSGQRRREGRAGVGFDAQRREAERERGERREHRGQTRVLAGVRDAQRLLAERARGEFERRLRHGARARRRAALPGSRPAGHATSVAIAAAPASSVTHGASPAARRPARVASRER